MRVICPAQIATTNFKLCCHLYHNVEYSQPEHCKAVVYSTILTQPSHHDRALLVCRIDCVVQRSLMVYHGISHLSLVFSWHTMEYPTCHLYFHGIPWNIPLVTCIFIVYHGIYHLSLVLSWHTMEYPTCHLYFHGIA